MCIVELIDAFPLTTMAYKFSLSNERHYFLEGWGLLRSIGNGADYAFLNILCFQLKPLK